MQKKCFEAELTYLDCLDGGASKQDVSENVLKRSQPVSIVLTAERISQ
jgi:hypothetical protein